MSDEPAIDLTLEASPVFDLSLAPGQVIEVQIQNVAAPGPRGIGADDPPIDLTILFENALV